MRLAQTEGVEYNSPFWTTYFFAYLDYCAKTRHLAYSKLVARANRAAVQNVAAGRLSPTEEYHRRLIRERP